MQLIDSYPLPPGACFVCSTSDGPAVDTDRDESGEYGVHLYICVRCVGEAASLVGCLPPDTAVALREELERTTAALADTAAENVELDKAVGALRKVRAVRARQKEPV